jgi:hypothetical protein
MGVLKKNDYIKILDYYDIPITSSDTSKQIKNKAEQILAEKLCKCIKKVKNSHDNNTETNTDSNDANESRAIAICNDTIFRRKGIRHSNFTCKKHPSLLRFPGKKYSLIKRSKYLSKKQKLRRQSLTKKK